MDEFQIPEGKVMGTLCKRGHNYMDTGFSLRDKQGYCVVCQKEKRDRKRHTEEFRESRRVNPTECKVCGSLELFEDTSGKKYSYCVEHYKEIRDRSLEKTKTTNLATYGVEYTPQRADVRKKKSENHPMNDPGRRVEILGKIASTTTDRYRVEHFAKTPEFKTAISAMWKDRGDAIAEKISESMSEYVQGRGKEKNQAEHGVDYFQQSEKFKAKSKLTNSERYGAENYATSEAGREARSELLRTRYYEGVVKNLDDVEPLFSVDEYKTIRDTYRWRCKVCGSEFDDHLDHRFPYCKICHPLSNRSKMEYMVVDFIKSFGVEVIHGYAEYNNGKRVHEIDVFVPGKNIGFELDGLYFHSEVSGEKNSGYHRRKQDYFESRGITVFKFYDFEIRDNLDLVKSMITSKLGLINSRVFARKCVVDEVFDSHQVRKFYDANHILGGTFGKRNVGLFLDGELISLASFVSIGDGYNLNRFASKKDLSVVGGFSRIMKYFVSKYGSDVITYSDPRYSDGGVYSKNGFVKDSVSSPSFDYVLPNYRGLVNRRGFQKSKLESKLEKFDPALTEWENMKAAGFDRIWDCGKVKWVLKK